MQNIKQHINRNRKIQYDPLLNLHVIARELNCIKFISTSPNLIVISADDQIIQEVNRLMKFFDGFLFYSYDTTFQIGDFLMSPLLIRHSLLKNEPAFPVAYLYHDSKEEVVHEHFFNWIKKVSCLNLIEFKKFILIFNVT